MDGGQYIIRIMSKKDTEDLEKLVRQAQNKDSEALAILYEILYPKIFHYVAFRINDEEIEDQVADIFLKMVEKLSYYRPKKGASFTSWIFRIAHNHVVDSYRRKKEVTLAPFSGADEKEDYFLQIPDEKNPNPHQITVDKSNAKVLQTALKKIPVHYREILEFKYFHDLNNTEISHITGKSEGNIRILQMRGLEKMREVLPEVF